MKKGYFLKILPCSGDPRRDMARTLPEFTQGKWALLLEVSSPVTGCCISLMLKSRIRWEEPWRETHDNKITQLCPSPIQWSENSLSVVERSSDEIEVLSILWFSRVCRFFRKLLYLLLREQKKGKFSQDWNQTCSVCGIVRSSQLLAKWVF